MSRKKIVIPALCIALLISVGLALLSTDNLPVQVNRFVHTIPFLLPLLVPIFIAWLALAIFRRRKVALN